MAFELQIFEYERREQLRSTNINGDPWFVASDVCAMLAIGNPSQTLSYLDDDEKMTITTNDSHSGRRAPVLLLVNEPGLYSLIFRSRKPEAKAFKRWITHEVLPKLRKTGTFSVGDRPRVTPRFVQRYNDNWQNIAQGYFSVINELSVRLHGRLELMGHLLADYGEDGKEIRPDVSVGGLFAKWLKKEHPEQDGKHKLYPHTFPYSKQKPVFCRQYPNELLSLFIHYVEIIWIPKYAAKYLESRDPKALPFLPKLLPPPEAGSA